MAFDQNQFNQIFQSTLGRAPTSAETSFLKPYIDQGTLSYQQAGQYLQSTPEAMSSRNNQQQNQYQGLLSQNNSQILSQAADAANSSFAQNGRQFSSGQGNAVLQAGQQLAAQQSPMVAGNFQNNYSNLNNAYQSQGSGALQRGYDLTDSANGYARSQALYTQQSNDYQNLLRQQNTMGLQQGLIGLGTGAASGIIGGAIGKMFSDALLKKNIVPVGKVGALTAYAFEYKGGTGLDLPNGSHIGFMAHEVEAVHPEAVSIDRGFKKVDYTYLRSVL